MAPEYKGELPVGDEPSVVYLIVSAFVDEITTSCDVVYVPAGGVNTGVPTCGVEIVKAALATTEDENPGAIAITFNVQVEPTMNGVVYKKLLPSGVVPLRV